MSNGEELYKVNGVELCVETFGRPTDPAVLMIDGAGASMLWWEDGMCELLASKGRFVIRYDNRDTGRSTSYPPGAPDYATSDLAADAVGILDTLGIDRAHVVARSWGGGIGLTAAVDHPDRVASVTFVSSSTGAGDLPSPSPSLRAAPPEPDPEDEDAVVDYLVESCRLYSGGSPLFDEEALRDLVTRDVARTVNVASSLGNHYAITFDGPRNGSFGDIKAPVLVLHGDHDPLLPPAHGEALRDATGGELVVLPGAGHDLPRPLWPLFTDALVRHTAR